MQSIHIKDGERGHSYASVFQRCLDGNVEWVEVDDPYIRARHQVHNFVRFCELTVKSCKRLKCIRLATGTGDSRSQSEVSWAERTVQMEVWGLAYIYTLCAL